MRHFITLLAAFKLTSIFVVSLLWLSKVVASQNELQISPEPQDDYIEKDLSTRMTKRNYVIRRALGRSVLGHKPDLYSLFAKANQNARELPPVIFDYANMIQNDIILLDDSVETKTSKRDSATVPLVRHNMCGPLDTKHSCNCAEKDEWKILGSHHYPHQVIQKICKPNSSCSGLFQCRPINYTIKVLKKFDHISNELPRSLQADWSFDRVLVTVACICSNPDPQ